MNGTPIETDTLRTVVSLKLRKAIERRAKQQGRKLSAHVRDVLAADCGNANLAEVPPRGRPKGKSNSQ